MTTQAYRTAAAFKQALEHRLRIATHQRQARPQSLQMPAPSTLLDHLKGDGIASVDAKRLEARSSRKPPRKRSGLGGRKMWEAHSARERAVCASDLLAPLPCVRLASQRSRPPLGKR